MPAGRLARQNAGENARVDDTSAGGNARIHDPASRDVQFRTTDSMSQSSVRPSARRRAAGSHRTTDNA